MNNFDETKVARDTVGRFDEKAHTPAEVTLPDCAPAWRPGDPIAATLTLQRWNARDYAEDIGSMEIDVRAILDIYSLEDLQKAGDYDFIFEVARRHGLVKHDGPFYMELPDEVYESYLETREEAGQESPVAPRFVDSAERAMSRLAEIREQRRVLHDLETVALQDAVLAQYAHARSPLSEKAVELFASPTASGVQITVFVQGQSPEMLEVGGEAGALLRDGMGDRLAVVCDIRRRTELTDDRA